MRQRRRIREARERIGVRELHSKKTNRIKKKKNVGDVSLTLRATRSIYLPRWSTSAFTARRKKTRWNRVSAAVLEAATDTVRFQKRTPESPLLPQGHDQMKKVHCSSLLDHDREHQYRPRCCVEQFGRG